MNWKSTLVKTGVATSILVLAACGRRDDDSQVDVDPPEIQSFSASPSAITSGTSVTGAQVRGSSELTWSTENAARIELFANGESVDLANCQVEAHGEAAEADEDNEESVACAPNASLVVRPSETTTYRLDVLSDADADCEFDDDGVVQNPGVCASSEVEVSVHPPALLSFDGDNRFEAGSEFQISFAVENASSFEIGIIEDGEFEACAVDSDEARCSIPAGVSEGEVTLRDIDSVVILTGSAENGADDGRGDIERGVVTMELVPLGTPLVTLFASDSTHVAFGESAILSWETEDAESIELTSNANIALATNLSECTELDGSGAGSCEIFFREDAPEITVSFTLVAHGEENKVSPARTVDIVLGARPEIESFSAEPSLLPANGGEVTLSWETGSNPTRLTIADDADPPNVLLDTADGTGQENCHSGSECDLLADSFTVEDVTENTRFTLTAMSPLGTVSASANVTITGAPQITAISVEGEDALLSPVIVDGESASISWTTAEANEISLQRAPRPDGGCDSSEADWQAVSGFSTDANGSDNVSGLTMTHECFRLTAHGEAGQRARETFHIVRHPEIDSFTSDRATVQTGDTLELSWVTPFASSVSVTVSPGGAATSNDLGGCSSVGSDHTGSCEVVIQPGTPGGDVVFTLHAHGFADSSVGPETHTITIGTAPTLNSFSASPSTAAAMTDVTLSWDTSDGTQVVISDATGEVYSTSDASEVAQGSYVVEDLEVTTTWTFVVSNQYGQRTAQTTTFFGPSVDSLDINGEDGLSGEVEVLTGDVDFAWTSTNADDSFLERADVPGSGECADVDANDYVLLADVTSGDGAHTDEDVIVNGCYRLTVTNDADQSNSVVVLVRDMPHLSSITTDRVSINGSTPSDVTVTMSLTGASQLSLVARFLDSDDEVIGSSTVCNLSGGGLTGSADEDTVSCEHHMDGTNCVPIFGCSYDPPQNTASIEYHVTFQDSEGDSDEATSDSSENVDVTW